MTGAWFTVDREFEVCGSCAIRIPLGEPIRTMDAQRFKLRCVPCTQRLLQEDSPRAVLLPPLRRVQPLERVPVPASLHERAFPFAQFYDPRLGERE